MLNLLKDHFPYLHEVVQKMILNMDVEDNENSI